MQQQKGNVSVTKLRDQFLFLRMIINDENNYILFCKMAFSDVLQGIASENCPRPQFSYSIPIKNDYFAIYVFTY